MANAITVQFTMTPEYDNLKPGARTENLSYTISGELFHHTVQSVDTTIEALTKGDVSSPGVLFLKNLDASNHVLYGSSDGVPFRLEPNKFAFVQMASSDTVYAKADTAACKVETMLFTFSS